MLAVTNLFLINFFYATKLIYREEWAFPDKLLRIPIFRGIMKLRVNPMGFPPYLLPYPVEIPLFSN